MSSEQTTTKLQFSTSQVFGEAWQILKAKWTFLLGVWAVIFGVSFVGEILRSAAAEQGGILPAFISLAIQVLSLILTIGSVKVVLKVVRGETADIAELFKDNVQFIWQYFLLSLVMALIVIFGFLLLIIPGVIWSLKYMFAPYALIDEKLSFSDAMAKSDEMTRGIKWQLFWFDGEP